MSAATQDGLWQIEPGALYGEAKGGAPDWLPESHRARWERLRLARLLFEGKHRAFYLDGGRTQYDYPEREVNGAAVRPYETYNLLRLVSLKTADLMFNARARLTAPNARQAAALKALARRSQLQSRCHAAVVDASWAGGGFLLPSIWNSEPYVERPEPDELYPIGPLMPDGQHERYERYATADVGDPADGAQLLLVTEFAPGAVTRRLHRVERGRVVAKDLALDLWPGFAGSAGDVPPREQRLALGENVLTLVANEAGGRVGLSDYDGLIGLQDRVNAKFQQTASVLALHADPMLGVPEHAQDPATGGRRAREKVYFFRNKDELPQYITWSAELDAAFRDREDSVDALCIAAEMSQVLLGLKKGAAPTAARTLRLEASNSLAKVGRKGLLAETAIARAVELAQRLDQTTSALRSYPVGPVGVELRDGLPVDELDEAQVIATLRGATVISLEAAVERRVEDPDAAAEEVARIRAEAAAALPTALMGEPPATDVAAGREDDDEQDEEDEDDDEPALAEAA